MGFADVVWMVLILGGAGYLLYRAVWKKKGGCHGCGNAGCHVNHPSAGCTARPALANSEPSPSGLTAKERKMSRGTQWGMVCLMLAGSVMTSAGTATAEEVRYTTHIKALVDARCAGCHGGDAPEYGDFKKDKEKFTTMSRGPRMDTYPHLIFYAGWPDTGALMRRLDDGSGAKDRKPGNMYRHLGDDEAERQKNLGLFKAWVGTWTHKRFPDLTKEELAGITVAY